MLSKCPECGNEYKSIGHHWGKSSCNFPNLSSKQIEIATGLMMGDAAIHTSSKNPSIQMLMVNEEYMKYIDSMFGIFGGGVKHRMTPEQSAKQARDSGFRANANSEDYSDVYQWRSMSHPKFSKFLNWYSSGNKTFPEDIKLTPITLKHWYCCDGSFNNTGGNKRIRISMSNEINERDKIDRFFKEANLPQPSDYDISERNDKSKRCSAWWTIEESKKLFEYMGEPIDGFKYKWPKQ
jgi:hypothetical protein